MIAAHQCVSPSVAPIVVGIAQHESGLRPTAIHDNLSGKSYYPDTVEQAVVIARSLIAVGHSSLDLGIGQINIRNLEWTGLTLASAFDPCKSFAASAAVLFAKYNGNPPDAVKASYSSAVLTKISAADQTQPPVIVAVPVKDTTTIADPYLRAAHTGHELVFYSGDRK